MRTRRRRLPRTRAAARLPGSLKFGVTNDASANPCDGKSGFTRRAPRHRAGAVLTSMRRVGPRVLFIDDIVLYRDDARQPLCPGFGRLSSRRPARMKIIAFSQRVLRAPGSGREWTCQPCGAGTYSDVRGAITCKPCGDTNFGGYNHNFWDPKQSGLTSSDDCKCRPGRTGTNCDHDRGDRRRDGHPPEVRGAAPRRL